MSAAESIIRTLDLAPLDVCGGFFRETWRDEHATVIYWLLPKDHFAPLHKAAHPEFLAFHSGDPVRVVLLHPHGRLEEHVLGPDLDEGQRPHLVIPAGVWQAAHPQGDFALMSMTVAPPFTPDIVTAADPEELSDRYPDLAERIRALC